MLFLAPAMNPIAHKKLFGHANVIESYIGIELYIGIGSLYSMIRCIPRDVPYIFSSRNNRLHEQVYLNVLYRSSVLANSKGNKAWSSGQAVQLKRPRIMQGK